MDISKSYRSGLPHAPPRTRGWFSIEDGIPAQPGRARHPSSIFAATQAASSFILTTSRHQIKL